METEKPQKKNLEDAKSRERIVRILAKDIEGKMKIYPGLTKIKGISWGMSNVICTKLNIDKNRLIGSLTEKEVEEITNFMKNMENPEQGFLINRQNDLDTGENRHLLGADLDLQKEFDIKRMRKTKSYKGFRHMANLTVRGQRTRGNFRKNRTKGAGIKKKK
ncbi:MAG: 30S ribosomal protein S13 [Nanoarchaeota archaeon]